MTSPKSSKAGRTFANLGVPGYLADVLRNQGFTAPFPIQAATLPDSLAGRDVLGRGRTGSGKTIAFALPVVERLAGQRSAKGRPRALILVPTRELAAQVEKALAPLVRAANLSTITVYGGVAYRGQIRAFERGVDIVIACPGRLEDLIKQNYVRLDQVEVTVIDEADHMADLGFLPGVTRLLEQTADDGQRMLFSATLDRDVDSLVKRFLKHPVKHSVEDESTDPDMEHHVLVAPQPKKHGIIEQLALGAGRVIFFTRTKYGAEHLAHDLTGAGIPAVDLHGDLSQRARDRNLAKFRDGLVNVLVATDVAARGIHVDDIALVVHVDPPTDHKAFMHRSGRTARAGAKGIVVTLQTPSQRGLVSNMMKKAGVSPTTTEVWPDSPILTQLTGTPVQRLTPSEVAARVAVGKPNHGADRGAAKRRRDPIEIVGEDRKTRGRSDRKEQRKARTEIPIKATRDRPRKAQTRSATEQVLREDRPRRTRIEDRPRKTRFEEYPREQEHVRSERPRRRDEEPARAEYRKPRTKKSQPKLQESDCKPRTRRESESQQREERPGRSRRGTTDARPTRKSATKPAVEKGKKPKLSKKAKAKKLAGTKGAMKSKRVKKSAPSKSNSRATKRR